jgi:hypothetical protein
MGQAAVAIERARERRDVSAELRVLKGAKVD